MNAIVSDGLFRETGTFYVAPDVDLKPLEDIYRASVLKMLKVEGKINDNTINKLMGWRHSGFSVHNGTRIARDDEKGSVPDRELFLETMLPMVSKRSAIFGIQTMHWKLTLRQGRVKLFHRISDPGEQKNVAEQHAVVRDWLVGLVQGYIRTQPLKAERFKPSSEHIEQLRSLGYIQ